MGVYIHAEVDKSVSKEEWEKVYEETLELVKAFPLAEKRKVECKGIQIICLVPSVEREETYGYNGKTVRRGWFVDGDYITMRIAEEYSLCRDLLWQEESNVKDRDALWERVYNYFEYSWDKPIYEHTYSLWGGKTQGEPYHIYILAIACLLEARLGEKVFVDGDITRYQCEMAVELANRYLKNKIDVPDRCDMERFYKRISKLKLSKVKQFKLFEKLYLGVKGSEFGEFIHSKYSEEIFEEYWKDKFKNCKIDTLRFHTNIREYLAWGFDLDKLCTIVDFHTEENLKEKSENSDNVEYIIDKYLKEQRQEQVSDAKKEENIVPQKEYNISTYEGLRYYRRGDSIEPDLLSSFIEFFELYNRTIEEDYCIELMRRTPEMRCVWLAQRNEYFLIREKDWNKIFTDIEENEDSFYRYYPMMRLKINNNATIHMVIAIVINDDLYSYCKNIVKGA